MATSFSSDTIKAAAQLITSSGKNRIELDQMPIDQDSQNYRDLQAIADLATPKTLDAADLFVLLSNESLWEGGREVEIKTELLMALDYQVDGHAFDDEFYEGCTVQYEAFTISDGRFSDSEIAKTRIQPPNYDSSLPPIVFIGGFVHKTPVYMKFLVKLAQTRGREVICVDSPGSGGSLQNSATIGLPRFWKTVEASLKSDASLNDGFVLMGHSLGAMIADCLRVKSKLPILHTVSSCPIGNMPIDAVHGQTFSLPFVGKSLSSMIKHRGKIQPEQNDTSIYYEQGRSDVDHQQLWDHIDNEALDQDPINFATSWISKPAVWTQTEKNSEGETKFNSNYTVVLAENDAVMPNRNLEAWQKRGAHIVKNADHSFLAGFDADQMQKYAEEISALIPD